MPNFLERLAQEQNAQQYLDFLIMRVRTMLSDARMSSVIGTEPGIDLTTWLNDYIGNDKPENGNVAIIDLSLVPVDVIHLVVAVISRIIFEALQRYRKVNKIELPTVIVMEEAHTFIRKFSDANDEISPQKMCCQTFERIAREGRKFGLGLLLSSQRPSELSPTVLSQCNTFLLHRIVNDKDQELVKRLIPDNLGSLLSELPVLPTRKAILLGWAAPIPVLLEMNDLDRTKRPNSDDPKFWDVWTGIEKRSIEWQGIVKDWQNEGINNEEDEDN
ncbi:ATP-binding protein [Sporomusa acidovorans]|uniref:ATP-binding protein n=1 Tax=Sporomusa acidovorans TaxID=112900 RepID=UPI00088C9C9D|nr:ATP-binding protein [Sporomusa acidovorans]OZC22141.1 AAA-like domain protein [Sporomusa acidovorans DSM 3132]SDF82733.1 AAA-like domain-containing protein [Sporomusa acidovorans]